MAAVKEKAIKLEMSNSCEDWEWQDWTEDLNENFLKVINPDLVFYITGRNMGWQNRDGWLCKSFEDAEAFCFGVFPDTQWNATFTLENKRLFISMSHHDSPMGEQYEVLKAGTCDTCGETEPIKKLKLNTDGWTVCEGCKN